MAYSYAEKKLWRIADGELVRRFGEEDKGSSSAAIALSKDGAFLVSVERNKIQVWDVASGELIRTLEGPIPVLSAGQQIDVEHMGHAAPHVADFDGDGLKDLLVGEFYQGRLRIYRNVGSNSEPRFEGYSIFQDGVPGGCIFAS